MMTSTSERAKLTFAGFVFVPTAVPTDPMWPVLEPAGPCPTTLLEAVRVLDSLEPQPQPQRPPCLLERQPESPTLDALEPLDALELLKPLEPMELPEPLEPLELLEPEDGLACSPDGDQDLNQDDSGFQSYGSYASSSAGHSRKTSESSGLEWGNSNSFPSVLFPSLSIDLNFNIWSPSNEDDFILLALSTPMHSYPELDAASDAEVDSGEWGEFQHWEPVPSPAEAAALMAQQKIEEAAIHARASEKRQRKKEVFFAKVNARRDKKILNVRSRL